jgi:hypothetical protein
MESFAALIDSFGGPLAFAKATGLKDSHVRTMKTRNSIPTEHWPVVVKAAKAKALSGITYELLTHLHAGAAKAEAAS